MLSVRVELPAGDAVLTVVVIEASETVVEAVAGAAALEVLCVAASVVRAELPVKELVWAESVTAPSVVKPVSAGAEEIADTGVVALPAETAGAGLAKVVVVLVNVGLTIGAMTAVSAMAVGV